ncbi:hypothetical protein LUQ84_002633 [Hamiltosporidium tvaerminnensis]|nr:hypothetical protein LUQ84_002633 [Hamiltosporidium tvaerminnensis]
MVPKKADQLFLGILSNIFCTAKIADLGLSCSTAVTESSIECNYISRFPSRIAGALRFSIVLAGLHADKSRQEEGGVESSRLAGITRNALLDGEWILLWMVGCG